MKVSKCHWNQGPSGTKSGLRLLTFNQPTSDCRPRKEPPPSTRASSCPPKQTPRIGTSAPNASISRSFSRSIQGMESSKAANSDPSDTMRS